MLFDRPAPLVAAAAALGVVQAVAAAAFALRRRLDARRAPPPFSPAATLFVPCAGSVGGEPENLARFLDQDYPGPLEVLFVVPSRADPAHGRIAAFLGARGPSRARVVAAGLTPERAAGKPLDLAAASREAARASEVFAFADADIRVARTWLRELVAPLADPSAAVSTAMTPFGSGGGVTGLLRAAWLTAGIPALELTRVPSGQSMALRRADFESLGLAALWEASASEDMSLARVLRLRPGRVVFAGRALPEGIDGMADQGMVEVFSRWLALFRIYRPEVWALGAAATAAKLFVLARGLFPAPDLGLLSLYAAGEAAAMTLYRLGFGAARPGADGPPGALRLALAAPLLPLLFAVSFLATSVVRTIRWGRYVYRVRGPQDVVAYPAGTEPGPPWDALAAAAAAGVLTGLSHHPGANALWSFGAYAPAFWLCRRAERDDLVRLAWLWGFLAWAVGTPWMLPSLQGFLRVGPAQAAAFALGLWAVCALVFAAWAWCAREAAGAFSRALGPVAGPVAAFVAAGAALEWAVPDVFPHYAAHALVAFPALVQAADWVGAAGLSAVILAVNAGLGAGLTGESRRAPAAAVLAAAALAAVGAHRLRSADQAAARSTAPPLRIAVVQGDAGPGAARRPSRRAGVLARYNALTAAALSVGGVDLVVWPESVYGRPLRRDASGAVSADGRPFAEVLRGEVPSAAPLLVNSALFEGGREFNATLTAGLGETQVVRKRLLMPFGEYMPFGRALSWLYRVSPQTGRLSAGTEETLVEGPGGVRLGVLICYEDKTPRYAESYARAGAGVLVGMLDTAWFPSALAHEQDLLIAAMRAVETRRPLVRAVNGGVSAVVSSSGRVTARLDSGREGVLLADVRPAVGSSAPPGPGVGRALGALAALSVALALLRREPPAPVPPFLDRARGPG